MVCLLRNCPRSLLICFSVPSARRVRLTERLLAEAGAASDRTAYLPRFDLSALPPTMVHLASSRTRAAYLAARRLRKCSAIVNFVPNQQRCHADAAAG